MSNRKHNLLIVAHPDDETIFFGGLLMADRKRPWHVVCVTDGNADGKGQERHAQFAKACKALDVRRFDFFDLPDRYESRLEQRALIEKIRRLDQPAEVYTHGPLGEYGHPHHQDVCLAVHETFAGSKVTVWGAAYNCAPDRVVKLTKSQFQKKSDIFANVYFGETARFIQFLPVTATEAFARFDVREVRSIHGFFNGLRINAPMTLQKYKWFRPYLETMRDTTQKRPF